MGSLSHTVLMLSYFHLWTLCSYPFQKWSRNQPAPLSGERGMDTSSSCPSLGWKTCRHYSLPSFEIIQGAGTFGPAPVSHSPPSVTQHPNATQPPVSQVSVPFPTASGQVSSAFSALPARGLIPQHLRELSSHAMPGSSCAEHCSLPKFFHGSAAMHQR